MINRWTQPKNLEYKIIYFVNPVLINHINIKGTKKKNIRFHHIGVVSKVVVNINLLANN